MYACGNENVVKNNIIHHTTWGLHLYACKNNTTAVRGNLIYRNGGYWQHRDSVILKKSGSGVIIGYGGQSNQVTNNIIADNFGFNIEMSARGVINHNSLSQKEKRFGSIYLRSSGVDIINNIIDTPNSIPIVQNTPPRTIEGNLIGVDPLFGGVSSFYLRADSPAMGQATSSSGPEVTEDYLRNLRKKPAPAGALNFYPQLPAETFSK
jgi:parallel beta-helix repeat protein